MTRFGELWELCQQLRTAGEKDWKSLLELLDLPVPPQEPTSAHRAPAAARTHDGYLPVVQGRPTTPTTAKAQAHTQSTPIRLRKSADGHVEPEKDSPVTNE
ncbi:hypothetical protein C8034_v000813 [Colletotrichum sidae]|uniref:Uncharacterized protein n=1 Tax=Colletotrichum sidae TaxID=1347389 RepID=A0A4R8TH69_9PEZI|nr:hypothetical protein C8034_v000813 [Colletotrichum sidae]